MSFLKIGAVTGVIYVRTSKNFCPNFPYFSSNVGEPPYSNYQHNATEHFEFCENRCIERPALF
jgi:hypothetical protein